MQEASNYPANKFGQALRGREEFGCPLAQQLSDRFCSLPPCLKHETFDCRHAERTRPSSNF
jgi:hypothetical protein